MWRMEQVLRELKEEGILEKSGGGLPPGFRFHPTDEELITFYLASKVFNNNNLMSSSNSGPQIVEVDLTRCEPWDLPERAKMGEREWYMYSLRDRKYPSGLRTNRATETGYWKATGKDRQVYATAGVLKLIGMKKTLVFYKGRAPRGVKTRWVMHEYRLDGHFSSFRLSSKEEWVICRIFHKNGEKKVSPINNTPPSPPPLPLAPPELPPFLSCLPPLQEPLATTPTTTQHPHYANYDLLHTLLSNPLPNFSSISGCDTIFPPLNTNLQTTSKSFHHPFPQPKDVPYLSSTTTPSNCQQDPLHWLHKICPQLNHHHHHNPLTNFDMMDSFTNAASCHDGNHDDDDEGIDVHHVDLSPSIAVATLDRMLNHHNRNINQTTCPESWTFHP